MTNASAPSRHPVSLSFKEFRDEEIVEFFANERRSFHPDTKAGGYLCRSRIVGAPHLKKPAGPNAGDKDLGEERKPTAAFRDSIPLSDDGPDEEPVIRVARIPDPVKRKRKPSVEPAFGKPTRPLGALLAHGNPTSPNKESRAARVVRDPLEKNRGGPPPAAKTGPEPPRPVETEILGRLRKTDEQLRQLIESWPTLPAQLKETIATLIEVSEKTDAPPAP